MHGNISILNLLKGLLFGRVCGRPIVYSIYSRYFSHTSFKTLLTKTLGSDLTHSSSFTFSCLQAADIKKDASDLMQQNEDLFNEVAEQRVKAEDLYQSGIQYQQVCHMYNT